MRKLASVQTISEIKTHPNADSLELAIILGWQVAVVKDSFKVGDKVVYMEVDSILPPKPEFEFLASKKYRIKTIRLRGERSEGIVFGMEILPKGTYEVGDDVTELLGVTKYLTPQERREVEVKKKKPKGFFQKVLKFFGLYNTSLGYKLRGLVFPDWEWFPSYVSKTDETRVQNNPRVLSDGLEYFITEKIEGTSVTYGIDEKNNITTSTRNYVITPKRIKTDPSLQRYIDVIGPYCVYESLQMWKEFFGAKTLALQGEMVGPGISGNIYGLTEDDFYLFNLVIDGKKYSVHGHKASYINNAIKRVPVLGTFKADGKSTVDSILEAATFTSTIEGTKETLAEGMVLRAFNAEEQVVSSFKVVSPEYLLKKEKKND